MRLGSVTRALILAMVDTVCEQNKGHLVIFARADYMPYNMNECWLYLIASLQHFDNDLVVALIHLSIVFETLMARTVRSTRGDCHNLLSLFVSLCLFSLSVLLLASAWGCRGYVRLH